MSSFPILDLVVGIIFIYFLLSIICSSVVEMILTTLNARSKLLGEWLSGIFSEQLKVGNTTETLGQAIMDHCSVTALSDKGKSPSYIDAKNFTSALLEKITYDPANPESIANDLNTLITKIQQTTILSLELKRVFLSYAYDAKNKYQDVSNKVASDIQIFRLKIENWYDTSMNRLTGDLKRRYSRPATLLVSIIIVLLMNADSINIAQYLYSNPDARAQLAEQAYKAAEDTTQSFNRVIDSMHNAHDSTNQQLQATLQSGMENINKAKAALEETLPFGWTTTYFKTLFPTKKNKDTGKPETNTWAGIFAILSKLTGLAATILAMMLGAPFWFDLLNKITNLRGTGGKPASSSNTVNAPATTTDSPAPVAITLNTNTDQEAVG